MIPIHEEPNTINSKNDVKNLSFVYHNLIKIDINHIHASFRSIYTRIQVSIVEMEYVYT